MCRGRERKQGRTRVPDERAFGVAEGRNGPRGGVRGGGGEGGGRAARRTSRIAGEACLSGCATCARLRYARLMSSSVASRPTAGEGERERERASGGGGCRCRCAGTTDATIETEGRWSTHARGSRTDRARPPAPRPRPRGRPARPSRPRRARATRVGVAKGGVVGNIIIILRLRATARALPRRSSSSSRRRPRVLAFGWVRFPLHAPSRHARAAHAVRRGRDGPREGKAPGGPPDGWGQDHAVHGEWGQDHALQATGACASCPRPPRDLRRAFSRSRERPPLADDHSPPAASHRAIRVHHHPPPSPPSRAMMSRC